MRGGGRDGGGRETRSILLRRGGAHRERWRRWGRGRLDSAGMSDHEIGALACLALGTASVVMTREDIGQGAVPTGLGNLPEIPFADCENPLDAFERQR